MNKREILERLQKGEITSDEALKMLNELEKEETIVVGNEEDANVSGKPKTKTRKWLIIKAKTGKETVNVRIPLAVARFAKKIGIGGLDNVDIDSLLKFVDEEGSGRFIDIHNEDEDVEIYVE